MTYADVASLQTTQLTLSEHFVYQAHALHRLYFALGALGIADSDAAALLASVLEGKQAVVNGRCHIMTVKIVDTKNAALLMESILLQIAVKI
jgi:hypothetical protein